MGSRQFKNENFAIIILCQKLVAKKRALGATLKLFFCIFTGQQDSDRTACGGPLPNSEGHEGDPVGPALGNELSPCSQRSPIYTRQYSLRVFNPTCGTVGERTFFSRIRRLQKLEIKKLLTFFAGTAGPGWSRRSGSRKVWPARSVR